MYFNPPPDVVASWPAPSSHPETRASTLLAVTIIYQVVLTITVGLRTLSRVFISKAFSADDWMIVPAYVSLVK